MLERGFQSQMGLELLDFSKGHFLKLVIRGFLRVFPFPPLLHLLIYLVLFVLQVAHKASTRARQRCRSAETRSRRPHVQPFSFISLSTVLLQVSLGRPLFLWPSGVHRRAILVKAVVCWRSTCPIHRQRLRLTWVEMGSISALWCSSSLVMVFSSVNGSIQINKSKINVISTENLNSWTIPSHHMSHGMLHVMSAHVCCTWFAHNCALATWAYMFGDSLRLSEVSKKNLELCLLMLSCLLLLLVCCRNALHLWRLTVGISFLCTVLVTSETWKCFQTGSTVIHVLSDARRLSNQSTKLWFQCKTLSQRVCHIFSQFLSSASQHLPIQTIPFPSNNMTIITVLIMMMMMIVITSKPNKYIKKLRMLTTNCFSCRVMLISCIRQSKSF